MRRADFIESPKVFRRDGQVLLSTEASIAGNNAANFDLLIGND
jgi:hypothetical protein